MAQSNATENEEKLNPIARSLNEKLEAAAPEVLAMLSAYGRRLYFPKGIISQTAEAKQKASRFNATIGIATEDGGPMALPSITRRMFPDSLKSKTITGRRCSWHIASAVMSMTPSCLSSASANVNDS